MRQLMYTVLKMAETDHISEDFKYPHGSYLEDEVEKPHCKVETKICCDVRPTLDIHRFRLQFLLPYGRITYVFLPRCNTL